MEATAVAPRPETVEGVVDDPHRDAPAARSSRLAPREVETLAVGALAAASAFLAGLAGCSPVGTHVADVVWTGLLAAGVTALGSRATPVALATGAVVALVAGETFGLRTVALVALALVVVAWRRDRAPAARGTPAPVVAAAASLLLVQVLVRLPLADPPRASALLAAAGMAPIVVSGWRRLDPARATTRRRAVGIVAGVLGLAVGAAAVAVLLGASSLRAGAAATDDGLDAIRAGDQGAAEQAFRAAASDMDAAAARTGAWWTVPARQVPGVAQQIAALDAIANAGGATAALAADGAAHLDAERLRLVDGRIDPEAVAAAQPVLEDVANATAALHEELVDPDRRSVWQLPPIVDGLDEMSDAVAEAEGSARTGALAAEVGPALLGADGEARYLLAFVSPSEARGTGFVGNYGVLTATDGRIELSEVGRNDDLNAGGSDDKEITGPPDYLARYSRFEPASTWENVTLTPDGPTAGRVMAELYEQSGGEPVDGVIRIDPIGLSRLLRLTGPVTVEGLPYALDASNVVSFLQIEQYRLFDVADERSDLLGEVAEGVFDALTSGEGPAPERLAGALGPAVRGGHVSVWLRDPRAAQLVDRLGASGAVPPVVGDGLGVVSQNAGGSKIDVFLQRRVRYDAVVDAGTGAVRSTAQIVLANDAPASGEPAYLIGNLVDAPDGTNRTWLSVYSPLELEELTVDGRAVEVEAERELDRNVWSVFVDIPPGAETTVEATFAGRVDLSGGEYRFDWLPQVMANPDQVEVEVTVEGGEVAPVPHSDDPPGGVVVDGATAVATNGDEQGAWALVLEVTRPR